MGWNSWDCYGASVTEQEVRANGIYMAEHLLTYGWEYIVVDIQWYEPHAKSNIYNEHAVLVMDTYGRLQPAENRFPSARGGEGFRPLARYIHSLGLKFGIHILRGIPALCHNSCHLEQDGTGGDLWLGIAPRYGIQFLKSCFHQKIEQQHHWPGNTIYR